MKKNEEIVRQAMQVIWNDGDISRVDEFYAKDFEADYPITDWGLGLEGVSALVTQVHRDLPGYAEEIVELIDAGDNVVVMLSISGCHPTTKEHIKFRDVTILTLKNEKIVHQRGLSDLLSLYLQLGAIALPSS